MGWMWMWLACGSAAPVPEDSPADSALHADVEAVAVSGDAGAYSFAVTVRAPDIDCSQYANWWEVLSEDGELLFRRILWHSHASEQPVTRSGSPVAIEADQRVIVRAHLHPTGYGGEALAGTAASGFSPVTLEPGFAEGVEDEGEQATECWY